MPSRMVTLRLFSRPARPFQSWSTTFCLRAWVTAKSSVGLAGLDAELLGARDVAVHRGRLEQLLGRDAPDGAGTCRRPCPSRSWRC